MNDPWNVKCEQSSSQYVACMKLNGVPLLPPILSNDCRKEMQYYIVLAKEVEKRINALKKMTDDEASSSSNSDTDITLSADSINQYLDLHCTSSSKTLIENSSNEDILPDNINEPSKQTSQHTTDLKNGKKSRDKDLELPERDNCSDHCNSPKLLEESPSQRVKNTNKIMDLTVDVSNGVLEKYFPCDLTFNTEGPSTRLNNKSFTGSLIDIHTENLKESQSKTPLTRQSSYTLLNPSPALMAHLKVCSIQTGVDVMSISMSDSTSQLSISPKKRRSWDLESAKNTWSSMALELNKNNLGPNVSRITIGSSTSKTSTKSKLGTPDKARHSTASRTVLKSEQTPKSVTRTPSKSAQISMTKKTTNKTTSPYNSKNQDLSSKKSPAKSVSSVGVVTSPASQKSLISESEDPAAKVKELYDKIKQQQKMQITNLIEKQKREQMLLQQVFEEQNHLFYNQLKNVCPKSPLEVKQAWSEPDQKSGPVSLSQLIDKKSSPSDSPSSALSKYIRQCDDVLRKSRDITDSFKKQSRKSSTPMHSPRITSNIKSPSSPRAHSPVTSPQTKRSQSISAPRRRINYESASTDREFEPLLTDRTNDTMADLNVTFPTDNSCYDPCISHDDTVRVHCPSKNTHSENCLVNGTQYSAKLNRPYPIFSREREAATKIVAYAKGYLVRRLMRTERVEGIVQTIKDVLICALQLHQDREGIRGADVDLHRRLIQQITAACYSLHDTFVSSSPAERCALIASDRARKSALEARATPPPPARLASRLTVKNQGVVMPTSVFSSYGTELKSPVTSGRSRRNSAHDADRKMVLLYFLDDYVQHKK